MGSRKLLATALVLSALGLLPASGAPLAAQGRAEVVGTAGELYVLREGSMGELFPESGMSFADNPALALEIVYPNQSEERLLVPGTDMSEVEKNASVLFQDETETLFLLWQTEKNGIHSWLNLLGFRDGEWTEPVEITGSPFGWKSSPQLAVTRDSFQAEGKDGSVRAWTRTVAHLIWWEPGAKGPRTLYAPVVLIDGEYTGSHPVYYLDELAVTAGAPLVRTNPALAAAPRIEAGINGQSVVIGFVPPGGGELLTVALELLPGEISSLADAIRHQIIEVGKQIRDEGGPTALAGKVRHQIIEVGARLKLHSSVSSYVADQVHDRIATSDPGLPLTVIAGDIRHQIIEVGAQVADHGFDRLGAASVDQVIELPAGDRGGATAAFAPPDLIRVVQASSRPVPQTGDEPHRLYLSRDGRAAVTAWKEGESLLYRESRGRGWSDVRRLRLNDELPLEHAYSLLEVRAANRGGSSRAPSE